MLILHGSNIVLSRQELDKIISGFKGEVIRFTGSQLSLTELKQAAESLSFFGDNRLVVIENLFGRRQSQEKELILNYLKENQSLSIVLWENQGIDGRRLGAFSQNKIKKFDLAPLIFKFLDSFFPDNQKNCLNFLHQCLKQDPPEMAFYMLSRRVRQLLVAKDSGAQGLGKMAPWQQHRLVAQAEKFSFKDLRFLYQKLLEIDYQQKTGRSPFSLPSQLDLLIAAV